jgi:peptidylprolyl isomerase
MNSNSLVYLLILSSSLFLFGCTLPSVPSSSAPTTQPTLIPSIANPTLIPVSVTDSIVSLTTKNGQILIRLYSDKAPKTVANFLNKVNSGFYNNLKFHRVIEGFMAQGGDPLGTGNGGGRQPSELNNLPFKRGSLGLARTAETKDYSNDSQFFICFTTQGCQHLTSEYVNFGEVISGFDVLDKIALNDVIIEISSTTK